MKYVKCVTLKVIGLVSSLFLAPIVVASNPVGPEDPFLSKFATWNFPPEHKLHALVIRLDKFDDLPDTKFKAMVDAVIQANEVGFTTMRMGFTPLTYLMKFFNPSVLEKKSAVTQARGKLLFSEFIKKEAFTPPVFAAIFISPFHAYMLAYNTQREDYLFNDQVHAYFHGRLKEIKLPIDACAATNETVFLKHLFIYFLVRDKLGELPPALFQPIAYVSPLWNEIAQYRKIPAECYKELDDALKTTESWRLCMDFDKQRAGQSWVHYETTEPGTIPSLLKSFDTLVAHQKKPVSSELVNLFHSTATAHLADRVRRERSTSFGFSVDNASLLFLLTFATRYGKFARLSIKCFSSDYKEFSNGYMLDGAIEMLPVQNTSAVVDYHVNQTLKFAQGCNNPYLLAVSLIELSHVLVILHQHADGHTRSYVTLLLNKSLMDMGIPFCAFGNPNAFDAVTAAESLPLILEGIRNFDMIRKGNLPMGMKSTAQLKNTMPNTYDRKRFMPK